jgi:cytoskeleton protein RodZ
MSRDQVASTLRLPTSTITALEEERYNGLAPAAFIRGYLSGYARLVGLDADKLLAACEMRGCGDPTLATRRSPSLKKSRGETLLRWGSYSVLIGFVVATMVYWIANDDYNGTDLAAIPMNAIPTKARIAADNDAAGPAHPDRGDAGTGTIGMVSATTSNSRPQGPALTAFTALPATASQTLPPAEAGTRAKAVTADASTWPTLELEFNADSWIAVRDADGKRLAWETVKAGSSRHLRGLPPLKVVLGNANAVRVTYEGELFDPAPYTSGRIARFVVE